MKVHNEPKCIFIWHIFSNNPDRDQLATSQTPKQKIFVLRCTKYKLIDCSNQREFKNNPKQSVNLNIAKQLFYLCKYITNLCPHLFPAMDIVHSLVSKVSTVRFMILQNVDPLWGNDWKDSMWCQLQSKTVLAYNQCTAHRRGKSSCLSQVQLHIANPRRG